MLHGHFRTSADCVAPPLVVPVGVRHSRARKGFLVLFSAVALRASAVLAQDPTPTPTPAPSPSGEEILLLQINEAQAQQTRWLCFIAGGMLFVGVISRWRV
jgi:hypothetical protein